MSQKLHDEHINVIDLFCGVGGLTYGLRKAGLNVVAGYDIDESCKYAYEINNPKAIFINRNILEVTKEELNDQFGGAPNRVLVGCAPCQPYSSFTQKKAEGAETNGRESEWLLLEKFAQLIVETQPEIVSMENVTRLANKQKYKVYDNFIKLLERHDYYVKEYKVFCPDYGIPQNRRRLVVLASKYGFIELPKKTHNKQNYVSTISAIGNLPPLENGEIDNQDSLHMVRKLTDINLKRARASREGSTWKDWPSDLLLECHKKENGVSFSSVYGRIKGDEPAPTLTTQFYNIGTGRFVHPRQDRGLSLREGAILQSFPEDYQFVEPEDLPNFTNIGRHIGNAVPPRLGEVIGQAIIEHLRKEKV